MIWMPIGIVVVVRMICIKWIGSWDNKIDGKDIYKEW
jgi:hypothetical protein